jgi:hypothetical protein
MNTNSNFKGGTNNGGRSPERQAKVDYQVDLIKMDFWLNKLSITSTHIFNVVYYEDAIPLYNKRILANGTDYINYLEFVSIDNPELTQLKQDLVKYKRSGSVKYMPVKGLIKHLDEYAWGDRLKEVDPDIKRLTTFLKNVITDERRNFYSWINNLPKDSKNITNIQSKLENYLSNPAKNPLPLKEMVKENLLRTYLELK